MQIFRLSKVAGQIPNLLIRGRFEFEFEMLPYKIEGIPFSKAANCFKAGLNQYLLPASPLGKPVIAQVEPVNFCNLQCPLCLTTSMTQSRPSALLPYETFTKFIDNVGDSLLQLIFWGWGEPLLHPDFPRMVAYAKAHGVIVHTSTNGSMQLKREQAEELVDSGLDSIVAAVDGATQDTYEKYRKGGCLDTVIRNIKLIQDVRRQKGSPTPVINMRFVVMRHNEHELDATRNLARTLGVEYFTLKTVDMPSARGADLDSNFVPKNTRYRRYDYTEETFLRKKRPFSCMRPWKRITMDALGEIIPCEYDYLNKHSFGNISTSGALNAWKSTESQIFRSNFNLGNNSYYLCKDCTYKNNTWEDCIVEKFSL